MTTHPTPIAALPPAATAPVEPKPPEGSTGATRFGFEVKQDGMVVASGEAPTEREAEREAMHYAMVYSQDGPVRMRVFPVRERAK